MRPRRIQAALDVADTLVDFAIFAASDLFRCDLFGFLGRAPQLPQRGLEHEFPHVAMDIPSQQASDHEVDPGSEQQCNGPGDTRRRCPDDSAGDQGEPCADYEYRNYNGGNEQPRQCRRRALRFKGRKLEVVARKLAGLPQQDANVVEE
jgi:hypothetical protein